MSKEEFAAKLTPEQIANYPKIFKKVLTAELVVAFILLALDIASMVVMGINATMKTYLGMLLLTVIVLIIAILIIFAVVKSKYPYYKESVYFYLKKQGKI